MRTIKLDTFQGVARVLGRDCPVALGAGVLGIHALSGDEKADPEFAMRILEALDAPTETPKAKPGPGAYAELARVSDRGDGELLLVWPSMNLSAHATTPIGLFAACLAACPGASDGERQSAARVLPAPGTAAIRRVEGGDYVFEATDFEGSGTLLLRASSAGDLFAALAATFAHASVVRVTTEGGSEDAVSDGSAPVPPPVAAPTPPAPVRRQRKPPIPLAAPAPIETGRTTQREPSAQIIPTEPPPPPPPAAAPAKPASPPAKPALHLVGPEEDEDEDPDSAGGCPNDPGAAFRALAPGLVIADLIPVPEALSKATKLREVVVALTSHGRATAEQIEAACAAFKALSPCPVPVLDRIPSENLRDRLSMVFTVLNIGQAS